MRESDLTLLQQIESKFELLPLSERKSPIKQRSVLSCLVNTMKALRSLPCSDHDYTEFVQTRNSIAWKPVNSANSWSPAQIPCLGLSTDIAALAKFPHSKNSSSPKQTSTFVI